MDAHPGVERRKDRRAEQEDLRKIVECQADGIVIVGADGLIRFANPAAERLFGRPAAELQDQPFGYAIVTGENAEIEVVQSGGESITAELRAVDIDWNAEPARLVSLRDVTDRRRANERAWQLERERAARAEAEAANRAKSEFLATMSHELRTPLNAVIGYADLLELGISGSVNDEQRHQIQRIRTSGRHLLGLVNEVLDLARIEAGHLPVMVSVASASTTAEAAIALVQQLAEAKGITFEACDPETDALYEGDEDRVRQVLVNLLSNALKFTPAGGKVTVECGVTDRPGVDARLHGSRTWVFLRVTDTGIGIPAAQLPAIFDPFVQVSSGHTRTQGGSGLGLTISRRLARLMRGDITVRSSEGQGSAFTLWLPAARHVPAEARPSAERRPHVSRPHGLAEVGELVLHETAAILESFVARLRTEPAVPVAASLRFAQLADHVACYLADVGGMLVALDDLAGRPSSLLGDGREIQRLVAERHGAQRSGLGWTIEAVHREYEVLREELERVVRHRTRHLPDDVVDEAVAMLARFVEQAEHLSCRAFLRAALIEAADERPRDASG